MKLRRTALAVTAVCLVTLSAVSPVHAEWIHADVADTPAEVALDAPAARSELSRDLVSLGVDPVEARARVAALSDAEVVSLAGRLEEQAAGQGFVGAVVGVVAVSAAVLFFTDLFGITDVFSFLNPLPDAPASPSALDTSSPR